MYFGISVKLSIPVLFLSFLTTTKLARAVSMSISDLLWQKEAIGKKTSFARFSLDLITNKFLVKMFEKLLFYLHGLQI